LPKKLELKETGQDHPVFSFTGKRQYRLLDQYSKLTQMSLMEITFLLSLPDFLAVNNGMVFTGWVYGLGALIQTN